MLCIRKVEERKMMALKEENICPAALFAKYAEVYFANAVKTSCAMSGMW